MADSAFETAFKASIAPALAAVHGETVTHTVYTTDAASSRTAMRVRDSGPTGSDRPDRRTRLYDLLEADGAVSINDTIADDDGTWTVEGTGVANRPGFTRVTVSQPHLHAPSAE